MLLLPDGDDPDSFARKHKAEEFQKYIDTHQVDFIKFKIDLLMSDAQSDPLKRAELVTNVVKSISVIPNEVVRQMYIHECATSLSVSEELIVNEINKQHRAKLQAERKKTKAMLQTTHKLPTRLRQWLLMKSACSNSCWAKRS